MKFKKWIPKLTPSGMHDNGYWELPTWFNLMIPEQLLNNAIVERITVKTLAGNCEAYQLTINGVSYKVQSNKDVKDLF